MPSVVSNSTPLIYLAKIGKLDLLKTVFGEVLIPEEVKIEVVEKGKQLGRKDAYTVENAILQGWIRVLSADPIEMPIILHKGEQEALALAKQQKATFVLMDEVSARSAARLLGLNPKGTLFVLLAAMRKKQMGFDEFLQTLDQLIEQGFRLKEEVYVQAVKEAKNIIKNRK